LILVLFLQFGETVKPYSYNHDTWGEGVWPYLYVPTPSLIG